MKIISGCTLLTLLLLSFQTLGLIQLTPKHNGRIVSRVAGSSVNFTWSFSGGTYGVLQFNWGLKKDGADEFIEDGTLVALDKTGSKMNLARIPAGYSGRVTGSLVGNNLSGQVMFTLRSIKKSDERFYGCEIAPISDFDNPDFDHVYLFVKEPPSITYPTSANASNNEGRPVNISCTATGTPDPDVRWIHEGKVMSFGSKAAYLTFSAISRADKGIYTCRANNSLQTTEKQLNLVVNYKPEGITIATNVKGDTAMQGENVTLTCDVKSANPPVSDYWFYHNDNSTALNTVTNINQHTIYGVQREKNYGEYWCVAHNQAGNGKSDSVLLNINVPAKIESLTGNLTVNETNSVELICVVTGYPVPAITWEKDGQQLESIKEKLYFNSIKASDSGAYVCIADNKVGRPETKRTFVIVQYPATIKSATSSVSKSWIGETVKLQCASDGVPTPTLSWYKPEGTKFNSVKAKESTVDVTLNSDQDFGFYNCTAYNGFVPDSMTVRVQQIKAPGSPSITSTAADIQATSLKVKWTAPADNGGSSITAYRVVILQGDKVIKNENVTDTSVREKFFGGLDKNTSYTVKVYSRNYVFEGDAAQKIIKTNYEGVPAAAEIVGLPAETKDVVITIKWREPPNNGASISTYTVYQRTVSDDGTPREWNTINVIKEEPLKRQVPVKLEKGKNYQFVVTATNRFGESLKEGGKIKTVVVLGGVPAAVQFTAEEKDGVITLKWKEPENNGAAITKYSVYQRFVNDKEWEKPQHISDTSKLEYDLKGDEGKEYEFVVTATNKYGESSKTANIQTVKVLKGEQNQPSGGMNMAVIAGAAAAGVLLILALIIFGIWWKRRKAPSEHGSSVADLSGHNPDDFDDGYHAVGAAAAAHQLQASGRAAEATYAQVDMSQKKNRQPVTDLYAQVDKSKKTKKKRQKQPGELDYAELDDLRPNFQPAPQPPGAAARPLVRAPAYEGTEYADITQFGVPQPEPTYDNVPKKDVVYSNVENI